MSDDTFLSVDVSKIIKNIEYLSKGKEICIMIKANVYGAGYGLLKYLIDAGYNYFGVSTIYEANKIREVSDECKILIVTNLNQNEITEAKIKNYIVSINQFEDFKYLNNQPFHLKLDIGMNRLGFKQYEFDELRLLLDNLSIKPEGIYSHFPFAANEVVTKIQIDLFKEFLNSTSYEFKEVHLQNSIGCINYEIDFCNVVRPGLAVLGYLANKSEFEKFGNKLKPALSLNAKINSIKYVDSKVGYDLTQEFKGNLATIRIGYHDGVSRSMKGYKFNTGQRIIGNICMCQMMIEIFEQSDFFQIFGSENSIYDFVEFNDKIVYELLVAISNRIKRVYVLES